MKHGKIFICICFVVCMLFAISSVNAGIFEFLDDTGDVDDNSDLNIENDDKDDKDDKADNDDENYEIEEFTIKISKPKSVKSLISELKSDSDYVEFSGSYGVISWLSKFDDKVLFTTDAYDYLIVAKSESDKIPSPKKYSYCDVECKLVETNYDGVNNYYVVKDIKVKEKIKKESEEKSTESSSSSSSSESSHYSSSSQGSENYAQSYSNGGSHESQSAPYIGNANTGKFHAASCRDVDKMNPSNMVELYSRDEAINNGYVPCGHCGP